MTVEILGDEDEAKQFKEQDSFSQPDLESDHDNDNQEVEVTKKFAVLH